MHGQRIPGADQRRAAHSAAVTTMALWHADLALAHSSHPAHTRAHRHRRAVVVVKVVRVRRPLDQSCEDLEGNDLAPPH